MSELLARVAVLETDVRHIKERGDETHADVKSTKSDVADIKLLMAQKQGQAQVAWWGGKAIGYALLTIWTAIVGMASSSFWMPKIPHH